MAIRKNNWQTFSWQLLKWKQSHFTWIERVNYSRSRVMREHYYFSIYNKSISMRVRSTASFSCFTNISTRKDFKEPNWFQSLIKTGYHYYILIQINTLSFLRDHRTSEMIFCTWFLNIMLIFSSTTKQLLCSPMSIIHGGTTGSRVLCVYMMYTYTQTCVWQCKSCLTTNFLLDHQLKIA